MFLFLFFKINAIKGAIRLHVVQELCESRGGRPEILLQREQNLPALFLVRSCVTFFAV